MSTERLHLLAPKVIAQAVAQLFGYRHPTYILVEQRGRIVASYAQDLGPTALLRLKGRV